LRSWPGDGFSGYLGGDADREGGASSRCTRPGCSTTSPGTWGCDQSPRDAPPESPSSARRPRRGRQRALAIWSPPPVLAIWSPPPERPDQRSSIKASSIPYFSRMPAGSRRGMIPVEVDAGDGEDLKAARKGRPSYRASHRPRGAEGDPAKWWTNHPSASLATCSRAPGSSNRWVAPGTTASS